MPLHLHAYILKQDDLHLDYKSATLKIYYKTGEVSEVLYQQKVY